MWDTLLREFVVNNSQLNLQEKDLTYISPKLWENYNKLSVLDLSNNPKLGETGIPEEFA